MSLLANLIDEQHPTAGATAIRDDAETLAAIPGEPGNIAAAGATPCFACGSPFAWLSVYDKTQCWECSPPPSIGMVTHRLALAAVAIGGHEWEIHSPDRWTPGDAALLDAGDGDEWRFESIDGFDVMWKPEGDMESVWQNNQLDAVYVVNQNTFTTRDSEVE